MTDSTTPNYGWPYPTVNADAGTWGGTWNTSVQAIDAQVKTVDTDAKNASNLSSGTIPDGRFPATLPALSGANLTSLNPANLSASLTDSQLPSTLASKTLSGTVTLPDSATWTSTGIANLHALGIGKTPATIIDVAQSQNDSSIIGISNDSTGSNASAIFEAGNGTSTAFFGQRGTGASGSLNEANSTFVIGTGAGGIDLLTTSAAPVRIGVDLTEVARFGTDGSFLVGSASNAGAGCIAATGNVTAYYSDDRLKTRLGTIDNALGKVLSLTGFYYEANETARALGYKPVREVGLSAQEVQAVLPEVVAPAPIDNQYLTLHYDRIVPLLVEAIKELSGDIEHVRKYLAL